jgi:hypothetical protein
MNLISNAGIDLSEDTNWQWNCPKCGSNETCSYRWELVKNETKIIEAEDNLPLKK